ncbi:hypothetical protein [uncultured Croceitalea sp.]|uniref:hypothetical protein n=1 Tax=uncultured Croceitalea sp. TaxID=1798908 RepID=UPI003306317C
MARLILTPEHQIQRLNSILNKVAPLQQRSAESLTTAPPKSWNVLEVLAHLSIALKTYDAKIEKALDEVKDATTGSWSFKARVWPRFVIEGQRPKDKKRPFKIKTLKRFEPILPSEDFSKATVDLVFKEFLTSYGNLKSVITESRTKQMRHPTFSSAIGPIVKFYLPEAFEFLICHAERHMLQIDEILASQD